MLRCNQSAKDVVVGLFDKQFNISNKVYYNRVVKLGVMGTRVAGTSGALCPVPKTTDFSSPLTCFCM